MVCLASLSRHYRAPRIETPSHTGGVSSEARERQQKREKDSRKGGVYASSSDADRKGRDRGIVTLHYFNMY